MIHGLGCSQNFYYPVINELDDYRCVAPDNYGAARSRSHGEKLSLDIFAKDVIGVLDELKIPKAVVVGHSMGGTMALLLATAFQDRVAGVVCLGPVNPSLVNRDVFSSRLDTVLKAGMEPLANTIPKSATNAKSTGLQRAFIRELLMGQDPASYASHCQVVVDMSSLLLDVVKCPVLILAGDEDNSAPLAGCRNFYDQLTVHNRQLKVMTGVGHWHCIEASGQVAEEVARFHASL